MNNNPPCEAVVLAGGLGTRLRSALEPDIPKPMAPICGRPFLSYVLEHLSANGISTVVLSVCHMHEKIITFFGDGYHGMKIKYSIEQEPLGTGGAIRLASEHIVNDIFFTLNGDTLFDVPFSLMFQSYVQQHLPLTIAAKPISDCSRYGSLNLTSDHKIISFNEKKSYVPGIINGGIYLIDKQIWDNTESKKKFSFEHDLIPELCNKNRCAAYVCKGFFIDIGVPEDLKKANSLLTTRSIGS